MRLLSAIILTVLLLLCVPAFGQLGYQYNKGEIWVDGVQKIPGAGSFVEVDPIWSAVSNLYATTNWVLSQGFLTAETDPIWGAFQAGGGTISGDVTIDGNLLPGAGNRTLGTLDDPWQTAYLQVNSLFLGTNRVGISDIGTLIVFTTDTNGVPLTTNEVPFVDSPTQGTSTNLSDYYNDVGYLTNEVDPVWVAVSNLYATTNWVLSQGFLTAETDPIWSAVSNLYARLAAPLQTWTGTNLFTSGLVAGTADTSLLGLQVVYDPPGPESWVSTNRFVVDGSIAPLVDDAHFLGNTNRRWAAIFLSSYIDYDATLTFMRDDVTNMIIGAGDTNWYRGDMLPLVDDAFVIGRSDLRWKIRASDVTTEEIYADGGTISNALLDNVVVSNATFAGTTPGGSYSEFYAGSGTTTAYSNAPYEIVQVTESNVPPGVYMAYAGVDMQSDRSQRAVWLQMYTNGAPVRTKEGYIFNKDERAFTAMMPRLIFNETNDVSVRVSIDNTGPQATLTWYNPELSIWRVFQAEDE